MIIPDPCNQLWLSLHMHEFRSHSLFLLAQMLETQSDFAKKRGENPITKKDEQVLSHLRTAIEACEGAGLVVATILIKRLSSMVVQINPGMAANLYLNEIESVKNTIGAELQTMKFFRVASENARFLTPMQFGGEVEKKFPSAITDIEEAGKCLAMARGTATVFHLMRVMEAGLKSLGNALGIPYAPSWESYIKQIGDKIAAKHKTKGVAWKRDEPFFREILGDLQTIKIAWRNPTMHIVRNYTPDEGEEIFRAVRAFMKRLATRFSQVK